MAKDANFVFMTINGITQWNIGPWYDNVSSSYSGGTLTVNYTLDTTTMNGVVGGLTPIEAHDELVNQGLLSNGSTTTVMFGSQDSIINSNPVGYTYLHDYGGTMSSGFQGGQIYATWYPYTAGQSSTTINLTVSGPSIFTVWNSRLTNLQLTKRIIVNATPSPPVATSPSPPPPAVAR